MATEFVPNMADFVDDRYKESLKSEGRLGELVDVDVISAISALIERGQWEKALETARQQKVCSNQVKFDSSYRTNVFRPALQLKSSTATNKDI